MCVVQELAQAAAVRLAPIPESTAAQCASGWLQDAAAAVAAGAPQLLAAADAPSLLAATEAAVRGTLASWASETSQSAGPERSSSCNVAALTCSGIPCTCLLDMIRAFVPLKPLRRDCKVSVFTVKLWSSS